MLDPIAHACPRFREQNKHDRAAARYTDLYIWLTLSPDGGFAHAMYERLLAGFGNRFIVGVNIGAATKGDLLFLRAPSRRTIRPMRRTASTCCRNWRS
jgi:hypothetical protein